MSGVLMADPTPQTYHILLKGDGSPYSGVTPQATWAEDQPLQNRVPAEGLAALANESLYFYVDVPAGAKNLFIETEGGEGDADLYVQLNQRPDPDAFPPNFNCESNEPGNDESCFYPTPLAARYYIQVFGFDDFSGVTLTATFTVIADVNEDGRIDSLDVQSIINCILSGGEEDCPAAADVDGDDEIDAMDVDLAIDLFLGRAS